MAFYVSFCYFCLVNLYIYRLCFIVEHYIVYYDSTYFEQPLSDPPLLGIDVTLE